VPARAMPPRLSFWRLQWIGWAAFWFAMTWSRVGRFPLVYMAASKAVMAAIGLAVTGFILRPLYRRWLGGDPPLRRTIILTTVASYLVAAIWTAAHGLLDLPLERFFLDPNVRLTNLWQVFGGSLYNSFTLLSWSVLCVGIKHQQALHAERERALQAEALAHSARLEALRYQLNPHFLFNSLNAISTLVMEHRNDDATQMLARLGDLLRSTLDRPAGDDVPLAEELDVVRRYLAVEQVRFGDRLQVDFEVDGDAMRGLVPPLILQPLVENSIRHAITPRREGGRLSIRARRLDGRLRLVVEDDGPGIPTEFNPGVGLTNTRDRLRLKYAADHEIALERPSPSGLRVRIDLPYHE
jgi:two-component system, LytTR family, sensor kinase